MCGSQLAEAHARLTAQLFAGIPRCPLALGGAHSEHRLDIRANSFVAEAACPRLHPTAHEKALE